MNCRGHLLGSLRVDRENTTNRSSRSQCALARMKYFTNCCHSSHVERLSQPYPDGCFGPMGLTMSLAEKNGERVYSPCCSTSAVTHTASGQRCA
jgi:hypothetical protein